MRLIGHRGARGEAPENTLSGFRYLRNLGVRAVELDIMVSADGELVVIHDGFIDRTTLGHGRVAEMTAAELAVVDATHRAFPDWPDTEGVPCLSDVMQVLVDFEHIQFEVKAQSEEEALVVSRKFPPLWREFGFGTRAFTTSFNPHYLKFVRESAPEIPRGFLFEQDFTLDPVAIAQSLGCHSVGPHQSRCTPELIKEAHEAGLLVSTWTVNAPERMRELAAIGVDSVITDVPALALRDAAELFSR
ncbi:MAG TPA: glycerophosphodiester phosphodiesterase family protein [Moraxellaceae bacterium]|nr:glycerophosphodiester phosphodiesterase family protein [Moraxellaceae bacterium]